MHLVYKTTLQNQAQHSDHELICETDTYNLLCIIQLHLVGGL